MDKLHTPEVDYLFRAVLCLESVEECYRFFEDACTVKEILDISQRLKAAKMLRDGENYVVVSKTTGMSTATISRVNKCLEYGGGGYKAILDKLDKADKSNDDK